MFLIVKNICYLSFIKIFSVILEINCIYKKNIEKMTKMDKKFNNMKNIIYVYNKTINIAIKKTMIFRESL